MRPGKAPAKTGPREPKDKLKERTKAAEVWAGVEARGTKKSVKEGPTKREAPERSALRNGTTPGAGTRSHTQRVDQGQKVEPNSSEEEAEDVREKNCRPRRASGTEPSRATIPNTRRQQGQNGRRGATERTRRTHKSSRPAQSRYAAERPAEQEKSNKDKESEEGSTPPCGSQGRRKPQTWPATAERHRLKQEPLIPDKKQGRGGQRTLKRET